MRYYVRVNQSAVGYEMTEKATGKYLKYPRPVDHRCPRVWKRIGNAAASMRIDNRKRERATYWFTNSLPHFTDSLPQVLQVFSSCFLVVSLLATPWGEHTWIERGKKRQNTEHETKYIYAWMSHRKGWIQSDVFCRMCVCVCVTQSNILIHV